MAVGSGELYSLVDIGESEVYQKFFFINLLGTYRASLPSS